MLKKLLVGACVVPMLGNVANACVTVTSSPGTVSGEWNPIDGGQVTREFSLTVTRTSSNTNTVDLIIVDQSSTDLVTRLDGSRPAGQFVGPRYHVETAGGTVISYGSSAIVTAVGGKISLNFQGNNNTASSGTLRLVLPANSLPPEDFVNGSYSETLRFNAYCKQQGNNQDLTGSGDAVSALATVPSLVRLTTASSATIDFGNFTKTMEEAIFGLKSTSSINVSVTTQNQGKMVRAGAAATPGVNETIPYTMKVDTSDILPGGSISGLARAGVTGRTAKFVLNVGTTPTAGKRAGDYSDIITVNLSPGT